MAQVYNHDWFQKYTREDPEDPIKVQVSTPIEIQKKPIKTKCQVPTLIEIQIDFMKRRVAVDAEHERLFLVE